MRPTHRSTSRYGSFAYSIFVCDAEVVLETVAVRSLRSNNGPLSARPLPLSRHPLVHTTDLDEARAIFSRSHTPVEVQRTDRRASFEWRANGVQLGPVHLLASQFTGGVHARTDAVEDMFGLSFALATTKAEACDGTTRVIVSKGQAGFISSPLRPVSFRYATTYRGLHLMVPRPALDAAFGLLAGTPNRVPLHFAPGLSLDSDSGAALARLLHTAVAELDQPASTLLLPAVAARFAEAFLFALLLGQPHGHSALLGAARPAEPRHVRLAVQYLDAHVAEPVRMVDLVAAVGTGVRSLQLGFVKHRGCSPMEYLRERRLLLARNRLLASAGASVTEIALACGFEHLGRFSARYRVRFGERPAETCLRAR